MLSFAKLPPHLVDDDPHDDDDAGECDESDAGVQAAGAAL